MNANELADCLDMRIIYGLPLKEAATMLRQQQTEIEALKQSKSEGNNKVNLELTDEEILQLWVQKNTLGGAQNIVDFARAILRKAQDGHSN